jgi:hypothetical protein
MAEAIDEDKVFVVGDEVFKRHVARFFSEEWIAGYLIRDVLQNHKGEWVIVATRDRFAQFRPPAE